MDRRKIAIACQGGGSHSAFAAGVLEHLLMERLDEIEIKGLSGSGGGAICAALAWSGLVAGTPDAGAERLRDFWTIAKTNDVIDLTMNYWARLAGRMSWMLELSPYQSPAVAGPLLRGWLKDTFPIELLPPPEQRRSLPLYIGATDVLSGERCVIEGTDITYDDLIASSAIPTLYEAVHTRGRYLWDGLFSVNPPIRELVRLDIDELWVVQINPDSSTFLPHTMNNIHDRRAELAGNISLAQELSFVDTINQLIDLNGGTLKGPHGPMRRITIRLIDAELDEHDYQSKLDRRAQVIDGLIERGSDFAPRFFHERSLWPRADAMSYKPRDVSVPPIPS